MNHPLSKPTELGRKVATAEWRHLVYLAFPAAPEALRDRVPEGVELDLWEGSAWLSLVIFLFQNVRWRGIPLPGLLRFPQLSLRLVVRRPTPQGVRKGIVVLKELTPKTLMARIGKRFHANWQVTPMDWAIEFEPVGKVSRAVVRYSWQGASPGSLALKTVGLPTPSSVGADENFFMERIWGYASDGRAGTREYHIGYPTWYCWDTEEVTLQWDPAGLFGERLGKLLSGPPSCAYLAKGSPVVLFGPRSLKI